MLDHGKPIKSVLGTKRASAGSDTCCIVKGVGRWEDTSTLRIGADLDQAVVLMYQCV